MPSNFEDTDKDFGIRINNSIPPKKNKKIFVIKKLFPLTLAEYTTIWQKLGQNLLRIFLCLCSQNLSITLKNEKTIIRVFQKNYLLCDLTFPHFRIYDPFQIFPRFMNKNFPEVFSLVFILLHFAVLVAQVSHENIKNKIYNFQFFSLRNYDVKMSPLPEEDGVGKFKL